MNYASAIPRLEYFAKAVGKLLDEMMDEEKGYTTASHSTLRFLLLFVF